MDAPSCNKRVRDDSYEFDTCDSPEVKRLREDLLDDSDVCPSQDLDSFLKSFEEEITASPSQPPGTTVVDSVWQNDQFQPDLGYLFEASDDELGLPPSNASPAQEEIRKVRELVRVDSNSFQIDAPPEFWGSFEDQIPSYDSFDLDVGVTTGYSNGAVEYVALDWLLFDYSDLGFGLSDNLWRPETLPAQ